MPIELLAHAGAGASWQALVTVLSWLLAVLFVLVATKRVKVSEPGDLVLPIAGIVIVSSMGTASSDTLSDQIGWSLPIGVVALAGLVLASLRPDTWHLRSRHVQLTVAAGAIAAIALNAPLTSVLHPPPDYFDVTALPMVDDVRIQIVEPAVDDPSERPTVSGPVTIVAEVTGGTVAGSVPGTEPLGEDDAPEDPEELGLVRILDGATVLDVAPLEDCSPTSPCTRLTWELDLAPGTHQVLVEFLTATGSTFRTSVFDLVVVTVE